VDGRGGRNYNGNSKNPFSEDAMAHAFVSSEFHCVFSTKERKPMLSSELRKDLFPCIVGIAQKNKFQVSAIGGTENHVHVLVSIPARLSLANVLQLLKGASSKWIHDSFPGISFAWQEGYGAFSIGISQRQATIKYINNQAEHHLQKTFEEEFRIFITRHGFKFDEKVCLG
jgi:REP element-mobilizing transposase RayT